MNLQLLAQLKTRDAAVIYEYLFNSNNSKAGKINNLSFELIASELNNNGIKTARGARFSAVVVRNRFEELEALEVVEREETAPGVFNLYVFMPYPCEAKKKEEKSADLAQDPYQGRTLFDYAREEVDVAESSKSFAPAVHYHFHFQNENENENRENQNAHNKEYININKKINNLVSLNETDDACASETIEEVEDDRPNVSEIRQRVDFSNPKVKAFREEIARRSWEDQINPDLIDRVVGLAVLHVNGAKRETCYRLIEEAKEAVKRYERTDGKAGAPCIWKTLNFKVKRLYETAGWKWAPTRLGHEPKPETKAQNQLAAMLAEMES